MQHHTGTNAIEVAVRRLILKQVPSSWREADLNDSLSLGSDGIGLDSVAVVELLLEIEKEWGIPFPAELLEQKALTVGGLIGFVHKLKAAAA